MSRRGWILSGIVASLLIVALVLASVPVTRTTIEQATCDLLGVGCEREDPQPPGPGEEEERDWRLEMGPLEAATWGHYVALGDSYSSGDGADDYATGTPKDEACYRSANAYPELIAAARNFAGELAFLACSGQRGYALLEEIDDTESQLAGITAETSLVTMGIGGNDLGFSSVLQTCMVRVPLVDHSACVDQEEEIDERMERFEKTFEDLLAEIQSRAPDARVLVVGYPRIFPEKPAGMYYTLNTGDQEWLNQTIRRFNNQLRDAVTEADAEIADAGTVGSVEFIDVYDALDGHEVGAEKPWVNGVVLRRDGGQDITVDRATFHPNAEGHAAVSELVDTQIETGPDRPLYVTRETIESLHPDILAAD